MDKEIFVQNVKSRCEALGIKPTTACKESGVGTSFLNDIKRGQVPSVAKVQILAAYLGATTSELLGENKNNPIADSGDGAIPSLEDWVKAFSQLNNEGLLKVQDLINKEFADRLK